MNISELRPDMVVKIHEVICCSTVILNESLSKLSEIIGKPITKSTKVEVLHDPDALVSSGETQN